MTAKKKRIEFSILAPEVEHVLLSGNFNRRSENADAMKKDDTGI
jgi:1,4-alpha-glucan branching enzyme